MTAGPSPEETPQQRRVLNPAASVCDLRARPLRLGKVIVQPSPSRETPSRATRDRVRRAALALTQGIAERRTGARRLSLADIRYIV